MLDNTFCPGLEPVPLGVWILCWLKSCVHCTLRPAPPPPRPAVCPPLFAQAPWERKAVTGEAKRLLGLYPD